MKEITHKTPTPCFRACANRGFQITFSNGWTISVQFGVLNYCSNKDLEKAIKNPFEQPIGNYECENAEIAIMNPNGQFVRHKGFDEDVKAFCHPDEISDIIAWVASR